MSYQALEEAFAHPKVTISKLQQFQKEHLQHFCKVNSIYVQWKGAKEPTKVAYSTALFNAVCHYHDPKTHAHTGFQSPATAERKKANSRWSRVYYQLWSQLNWCLQWCKAASNA